MGQLLLPIFPRDTEYLTPTLGVNQDEDTVYYYHSGVPIYSHGIDERNKFRYCTSNFLLEGLCKNVDVVRVFHVSTDSVRRWKKVLSEHGEAAFFVKNQRVRKSHRMMPEVLIRIQNKLDMSQSVNSIAKEEGISEGTIRYSIKQGRLKKKQRTG